ncbi:MAG: hypothetical protein U5L09_06845 [Bacteroidales bacterium]|nr:hypothetical protein [Bacteroidales bacterium]
MEMNEVLNKLPRHLMDLVIDQPYNDYTAQDHAVWRFVMRQNVDYLQHVAPPGLTWKGYAKRVSGIDAIPPRVWDEPHPERDRVGSRGC